MDENIHPSHRLSGGQRTLTAKVLQPKNPHTSWKAIKDVT
jgi:hypothetical protein